MFRLSEEKALTVYNGEEMENRGNFLSVDGSRPLPDLCPSTDPDEFAREDCDCGFDTEALEPQTLIHRMLILGEPLKTEPYDSIPELLEDLFNSWQSSGLLHILKEAEKALRTIKTIYTPLAFHKAKKGENDLYIAIGLLKLFIQLNYTGPEIYNDEVNEKLKIFEVLPADAPAYEPHRILRNYLEVDGCELDRFVKAPVLLLLAKYFLSSMEDDKAAWPFYAIWRFRIEYLQQRVLTRRSWQLSRNLKEFAHNFIQWTTSHNMDGVLEDVKVMFFCEISQMLSYYYDGILAERFLFHALSILKLRIEFSGKMGFRTKFQTKPTPQIIVRLSFTDSVDRSSKDVFPSLAGIVPRSESLNDDTRLETIRWTDDAEEEYVPPHTGIHQLVLLEFMFHKRGMEGTELDREESEAAIRLILDHPLTWSSRVSALMGRCGLEKWDRRTMDRCLRQVEELWKIVSQRDETAHALYRQHLFFGSAHPSKSDIKELLGEVLMEFENWSEALKVYTDLDSFDKIVMCYLKMRRREKAEELIRSKINELGETPKLLVLLGDATSDIQNYHLAWEKSKEKCVESQIKLGEYHFYRGEYDEAILHLSRVVKMVPLEYPSWIKLAWACWKQENYETAYQAYLHAANLEYDNFEVWNNLGNCALKLDKRKYALRAYKEAVKCNYEEWKVWYNILTVATGLYVLNDALSAYHRILDLNKSFSDEASLDRLVVCCCGITIPKAAEMNVLAKLLGRVTAMGTTSYQIWMSYARLLVGYMDCDKKDKDCDAKVITANLERGLQCYVKGVTLMNQSPYWKSDLKYMPVMVYCFSQIRTCLHNAVKFGVTKDNPSHKALTLTMRQTSSKVYNTLKTLAKDSPSNEKIQKLFMDFCDEINDPFYA